MMSGVDFGGSVLGKYSGGYDRVDPSKRQASGAVAPPQDVKLDSVFKQLADQLKGALEGLKQDGLPAGVTEVTVRASIQRTFEGSVTYTGPDGAKLNAYYQSQQEVNLSVQMKVEQAQQIAAAHAGAAYDTSPEATAGRIADFAMGFFPAFAAQHGDMSYDEQVDAYQKMVEGAIDQGFREAMRILGNLPGEVQQGIDQTRSLVDAKLSSIFDHMKGDGRQAAQDAVGDGGWRTFIESFFADQQAKPTDGDGAK